MNLRSIFKETCENDFSFYVEHFLKVIEPETVFEWNWHMNVLCHHCEKVYYGEIDNLDINIPPRMLKSLIVSVLFPTWIWTKDPSRKVMGASATNDLAKLFNIKRREIIESPEYQSLWPIRIKDYMNTINKFENVHNGFMQSVSVGSSIIGQGADISISDDLIEPRKAFSKSVRESTWFWYTNTFYKRVQDPAKAKRININQRLHQQDISGMISENYDFKTLVIPMQKIEKNTGTIHWDDPRQVGDFIQPSRYGPEEKEKEYKALGIYGWSSQMQQSPVPIGGGIVKQEWIKYYDEAPEFDKQIITADLAFKGDSKSDYVCFQAWGKKAEYKYLIGIIRGQWSYLQTKENFIKFCEMFPKATKKYVEDKANGPALISDLKSQIVGLTPWPEKSEYKKLDKIQRLKMCSADYEMGSVLFPKDHNLVEVFVEELLSFTEKGSTTGNDDMVDTMTTALIELKTSRLTVWAG